MNKVVFLGTGGWFNTENGSTTCIFLETPESYIIFDAGNGLYKVDEYIKDDKKPIYMFLSHFHLDHIFGLHILAKFNFPQGMTICCHEGGKAILNNIIRQPYTMPFDQLDFKVDIRELDEGYNEGFPFKVMAKEVIHSTKCTSYRIETGDKVITFCTDAGICPAAKELSKDADLLIAECSLKSGQHTESWPHLNPEDAAGLAKEMNVKKLVLIHFDAGVYFTLEERDEAEAVAKTIFENVVASRDDMIIEV